MRQIAMSQIHHLSNEYFDVEITFCTIDVLDSKFSHITKKVSLFLHFQIIVGKTIMAVQTV